MGVFAGSCWCAVPDGQLYNPFADDSAKAAESSPTSSPVAERDPQTGRFVKAGLSQYTVRQARSLGLTDDDLADMDPQEVHDHVAEARVNRGLERVFALQERSRQQTQPITQPTADPPFSLGVENEDDYDNGLVSALKKHLGGLVERVARLEAQAQDLPEFKNYVREQARTANESFARRVERAFAKHKHIFGTGTIDKLDKDSPEFHFRMAAVQAHRKAGAGLDDLEGNIDEFVQNRFGRAKAEPASETDEVRQWQEGVLGRPTQRGLAETPPGVEKAVQGVREKLPQLNGRGRSPGRGAYLNPR